MPPTVALFLTLGLIVWLFRRDFRAEPNVSTALWLPLIWIFIVSSKTVSQWLNVLGIPGFAASSAEEGNPLDAYVLFGLIVWGVYVLNNRQASLSQIVRDNQWLTVFVLYCFVAIAWSDAPIPSLRRWIKLLGHPVMVLVLLT